MPWPSLSVSLSILPEELIYLEIWAAKIFSFLAIITIAPWAALILFDILLYIYRIVLYEVPVWGGRARGTERPRAPSLGERGVPVRVGLGGSSSGGSGGGSGGSSGDGERGGSDADTESGSGSGEGQGEGVSGTTDTSTTGTDTDTGTGTGTGYGGGDGHGEQGELKRRG